MRRRLGLLGAAAAISGLVVPMLLGGADLDRLALALALAGLGAGTALAAAAGRPLLSAAALGGVGAYASGIATLHQVPVPVALLVGTLAGIAAGALFATLGWRLDGLGFLLMTLLIAVAGRSGIQAIPAITGAEAGLGPIPQLSVPLGNSRSAMLTPIGDFQLLLVVAVVVTAIAMLLREVGPGPRLRAVGSDRARAAASGLHPLATEIAVVAFCGGMAAICGALSAHISQVADPSAFSIDVAALPLLAALAASNRPLPAAMLAVGTGVIQQLLLPAVGWHGPPNAQAAALALLAVGAVAAVLLRQRRTVDPPSMTIGLDEPWPVDRLDLRGTPLAVDPFMVRSRQGVVLLEAPGFAVVSGTVHAVVGPNGAGKTTLLRHLAARRAEDRVVLLPQEGGGFVNCTVVETLRLAARFGRTPGDASVVAELWQRRLSLETVANRRCEELSTGQRRIVDLARVLLGAPNVLLCDEPLAGLDDNQRAAVVACLAAAARGGLTVVVAEHDQGAVAQLADSVTELTRASTSPT